MPVHFFCCNGAFGQVVGGRAWLDSRKLQMKVFQCQLAIQTSPLTNWSLELLFLMWVSWPYIMLIISVIFIINQCNYNWGTRHVEDYPTICSLYWNFQAHSASESLQLRAWYLTECFWEKMHCGNAVNTSYWLILFQVVSKGMLRHRLTRIMRDLSDDNMVQQQKLLLSLRCCRCSAVQRDCTVQGTQHSVEPLQDTVTKTLSKLTLCQQNINTQVSMQDYKNKWPTSGGRDYCMRVLGIILWGQQERVTPYSTEEKYFESKPVAKC